MDKPNLDNAPRNGLAAPRFSVLVPVWNAAPYIAATLHSVRKQGFASVEVIVMDGGSTDGTQAVVEAFEGLDITLVSEKDKGQLDALQKAARLARGDILYWLNADDILMPGSLAAVDKVFAERSDVDIVYSDDFAFNEENRSLFKGRCIAGLSYADHTLFYRQMYSECIFWRREVTRYLPDSDLDLRVYTDYAFFINMRRGCRTHWLSKRLGAFRIVEGQASARFAERKRLEYKRIRDGVYAANGWQPQSLVWRKAAHAPSFWLRQKLLPLLNSLGRLISRKLDGGAERRAQTDAFYDEWLNPSAPVQPDLARRLHR